MRRSFTIAAAFMVLPWTSRLRGQQPAPQLMGTVATSDALVTGGLEVQGERAKLMTNASITAYGHTAAIALARGGDVLVCATSQFHLLHSGAGQSLFFGLDRGALELHTPTEPGDSILTPDIRFTIEAAGTYDLRLRVTSNGDTCVENAGKASPVLMLNDSFSSSSYRIMPGQHVLFEHGSLKEVVDNERSPCGCPAETPAVQTASNGKPQHPFPAAESEGLAPITPAANAAPVGEVHTQISTTLAYNAGQPPPANVVPTSPATPASLSSSSSGGSGSVQSAEPPPTPPGAHDIAHKIGHFFHKLFHPHS
jgi:hypothetical protein